MPTIEILAIRIKVFPLMLVLSVYVCMIVFLKSKKYDSFYFAIIKKSMLYILSGMVICGKLLYLLTRIGSGDYSIFNLLGGFVFYGGFVGAVLGLFVYCKKNQGRFLELLDAYLSLLPLGQAIGRIGCYFNGCCYGKVFYGEISVPYKIDGRECYVFPTWFVESVFCFLLFVFFFLNSKRKYCGWYSAVYMSLYSVFRFILEFYRGDEIRGDWFGFSTSQWISVLIFFYGIFLCFYSDKNKDNNLIIQGRN